MTTIPVIFKGKEKWVWEEAGTRLAMNQWVESPGVWK